ncbi:MAG: ATP-binding protein [Anaerolineaceae bacterium]|nr:ATP-binding protein [Anaerolineaceae bacterium]
MPPDATRSSSFDLLIGISRELATSLDLHTVLTRILFLSVGNVNAERGSLIILDENLNPVDAAIVYSNQLIPHKVHQLRPTLDKGLAGWVLANRQAVLINDTSLDKRWLRRPDDTIERSGPKSAVCIPLLTRSQIVGILTIVHPIPGFFNQDHLELLQAIADHAGVAVYNARLYSSLQVATRRYQELFEDSIDPILITSWDGKIQEANRQAVRSFGYIKTDLLTHLVSDLHEVQKDRLGENYSNLTNGGTFSYESVIQSQNGNRLPVDVYVHKVNIGHEDYLQWLFKDVSERKALDTMRDDLIAMIYHDLRSPLANIISALDMLQSLIPEESAPSLQPVFNIATRSSDRMQRLINSLLDIHRLESGQSLTNQKPTSLKELVHDALDAVTPITESKKQTLTDTVPEGIPLVWVDADMVKRVITNLLENGTKFTPLQGSLSIGAQVDGHWVKVWIQDSGPGIPPESQQLIFEKFTRLQAEKFPKGLGLGLAFCKLAVIAHGGRIWVESKLGEGSRFMFTIPVADGSRG